MLVPHKRARGFLFAAVFFCACPILPLAAQQNAQPAVDRPSIANATSEVEARRSWRKTISQTRPRKEGCFKATFPNTTWEETICTVAPIHPHPPAEGPRPKTIGNGNDFCELRRLALRGGQSPQLGCQRTNVIQELGVQFRRGGKIHFPRPCSSQSRFDEIECAHDRTAGAKVPTEIGI